MRPLVRKWSAHLRADVFGETKRVSFGSGNLAQSFENRFEIANADGFIDEAPQNFAQGGQREGFGNHLTNPLWRDAFELVE